MNEEIEFHQEWVRREQENLRRLKNEIPVEEHFRGTSHPLVQSMREDLFSRSYQLKEMEDIVQAMIAELETHSVPRF